ncbi:MAG: hypothetical protein JXQ73_15065 [Phycisphaerae bacterium]|nr:hypothetical protein [Phycisphaerae bacterium]
MRSLVAVVTVMGMVCCTGCMTVAKQTLAEAKGASADVQALRVLSPGTAKSASSLKVGTISSDGAGAQMIRAPLQQALAKEIAQAKGKGKITGSGGALTINAVVRYVSSEGAGKLLGGMSFAIVRVDVTGADGQPAGSADVLASTKAMRSGMDDLANALAKKIVEWATTGKT